MRKQAALSGMARALVYLSLALALVVPTVGTIVVRAASTITLRAKVTANNGAGNTWLTIAKPSGTSANDVLVAQLVVNSASTTITPPAGWKLIRSTPTPSALVMASYYKVATSSEPSSYRWTFSATQPATGGITAWIGVNTTSPIDTSSGKVNGGTATASFTQITTHYANDLVLALVGVNGNTTVAPPAGFIEDYDRQDTYSTKGKTAEVSHAIKSTTGTTSVASAKESTLAVVNITQLIAIRPGSGSTTPTPTPTSGGSGIIAAVVGDMHCIDATCQGTGVNNLIAQMKPSLFFPDGDQVATGTTYNFNTYYDPNFGQFRSIAHPAMGNHDGNTVYYDYWNGKGVQTGPAGTRGQGWYSFNSGSWHFIVLNSTCASTSPQVSCDPGSPQVNWLTSDLTANTKTCTAVFMHYPYYTSGTRQFPVLQTIVQTLYKYHADLLISGHIHDYQRFYPQDGSGNRNDTKGIVQFVVGTGGGTLASAGNTPTAKNEAAQIGHAFGALRLNLYSGGYDYQFIPAPGSTGTDSGTGTCR
jgi:hypothetical protein